MKSVEQREKDIIGKYIIKSKGIDLSRIIYLQDRNISNRGYWTNYISNARYWDNKEDATEECNNYKLGYPEVVIVNSKLNTEKI